MQIKLINFLHQQHIVSFTASDQQQLWSAICFYCFDEQQQRLIILTKPDTTHGQLMLKNNQISGTIFKNELNPMKLQGIQFLGQAQMLTDKQAEDAKAIYYQRFPYARAMPSPVWQIQLQQIKFTDNTLGFGTKLLWNREKS